MPDGKSLLALSDQSGEVEFWSLPPNGVGTPAQITTDGTVLRFEGVPSPDGKWVVHRDKNQQLWLLDLEKKTSKLIDSDPYDYEGFKSVAWAPDSRWFSYDNHVGHLTASSRSTASTAAGHRRDHGPFRLDRSCVEPRRQVAVHLSDRQPAVGGRVAGGGRWALSLTSRRRPRSTRSAQEGRCARRSPRG